MEQNQINLRELQRMLEDLAQQNWAQSAFIFDFDFCRALALECQKKQGRGELLPAAIGHGATKATHSEIRGDSTAWLEEGKGSAEEQDFMRALRETMGKLNEDFYLGLKRYESHFALYPPGSGYDKHIDNHRGTGARKITFVLYLNENWKSEHGGELSIFDPENPQTRIAQVQPTLGTFVLFRSDLFPHQVEKSFQPRLSITGWFRNDAS